MNPQIPYYYFNRNSYGTFVDHELDQEDLYTSVTFIGATQNREEAIILAIVNIFVSEQANNRIPMYLCARVSHRIIKV